MINLLERIHKKVLYTNYDFWEKFIARELPHFPCRMMPRVSRRPDIEWHSLLEIPFLDKNVETIQRYLSRYGTMCDNSVCGERIVPGQFVLQEKITYGSRVLCDGITCTVPDTRPHITVCGFWGEHRFVPQKNM